MRSYLQLPDIHTKILQKLMGPTSAVSAFQYSVPKWGSTCGVPATCDSSFRSSDFLVSHAENPRKLMCFSWGWWGWSKSHPFLESHWGLLRLLDKLQIWKITVQCVELEKWCSKWVDILESIKCISCGANVVWIARNLVVLSRMKKKNLAWLQHMFKPVYSEWQLWTALNAEVEVSTIKMKSHPPVSDNLIVLVHV